MPGRRARIAAVAFMLSTGALGTGVAHADKGASQACKSIGDLGVTHGACVSLAQTGNPTASISDVCGLSGVPESLGTTNRGQCIKVARSLLP